LSVISQFSTPTFFVRFSSTPVVCCLDLCFQSPFCILFFILRCLFSFHRVFVHSSVQDRPELCSPFHSPLIWGEGGSVLPCRKLVLDLTAGSVGPHPDSAVPLPLLVSSRASACAWFLPSSRQPSPSSVVVRLTGLKPSVSGSFSARVLVCRGQPQKDFLHWQHSSDPAC
jgi:hypothetical protein